ncbi:MAG: ribosome assembly RNA-binding protein YhbY [Chiayiivirga sp.]|jgi:RNA-binding protein|uniref:Ribosome assembly RNA-binding protein YhbY n=1 Tax=Denitratimonas tolerans TaxID=1338420 RepID=A0AAW9R2G1_9GAMM|nr:ribosome assembly RNA-binding protein YhbY [Chiayiivirga sp.]HRQ35933.1 ribosome assembly RNA-binding protein YhbY [Chiayiivirga sp.]
MPAPLTSNQKRYLRGLAHPLKPVILVGAKGVTEALLAELDLALDHHELVKVRIAAEDRDARDAGIAILIERSGAQLVQRVGNIACLFRRNPEAPQVPLPR